MMAKKEILLLITPLQSTFIAHDLKILSEKYIVKLFFFDVSHKFLLPFVILKQLFWLLKNIFVSQKVVTQFGGYVSFLPAILCKIFRKPHFIILHGTDCASLPSVLYGSLRKYILKQFCKVSYQLSTVLLPVSDALIFAENKYRLQEAKQGIKHFFPKLKTAVKVVQNGVDIAFWSPATQPIKQEKTFLAVFSISQFYLKGGDLILSVAHQHQDCTFYIAGCDLPVFLKQPPKNVYFLGKLKPKVLKQYYKKTQFYFQLSMFEGFGLSLCESMLNQCIPIGSSVNIIPEIISDCGFILKNKNTKELNQLLSLALSVKDKTGMGALAQQRIVAHYSLQKRSKSLLAVLQ